MQNFPATGGKWQVSTGGGNEPGWNPSGKELFYLQANRLMAVGVDTESDRFKIMSAPRALFEAPIANPNRNAYLVSPDGQKILVNIRVENKEALPMTMVLNWPATIRHPQ